MAPGVATLTSTDHDKCVWVKFALKKTVLPAFHTDLSEIYVQDSSIWI